MAVDESTRRNLELTETMHGGEVRGSLLGVLDETLASKDGRQLRNMWPKVAENRWLPRQAHEMV